MPTHPPADINLFTDAVPHPLGGMAHATDPLLLLMGPVVLLPRPSITRSRGPFAFYYRRA